MKLSDWAVNRPVAVMMLVALVLVLGAVSVSRLNIDLFPEMNLPVAGVITNYSGAGPREVETLISRPLEAALSTANNVKNVTSMSQNGSSVVIVEFEWGTNMDFAALDLREKVDLVKRVLPADAEAPLVLKMDPAMMPVVQLALTGELPPAELKTVAEDTIKTRLERIEGVAAVNVAGGQQREIQVLVDPQRLQVYNLSVNQVIQALQAENLSYPGGRVERGAQDLNIRVTGEYQGVDEIAATTLILPYGSVIRIADVAQVVDSFTDAQQYDYLDGQPSISLAIQKQSNANTVQVSRAVRQALAELQRELPGNFQVATVLDQAQFVEQSIVNVVRNIITGGILAVIVLFLFLRSIASTMVISLAMPISIVATFSLVYFGGLSLNMMTLGGLALGVGMMVDSAIVILENIFRHRQRGASLVEAAREGSREMAGAITGSTLTTVVVFLPIVFVQGLTSQLFRPLALTVTFALLASLLVALTLIPVLSSRLLRRVPAAITAGKPGLLDRGYHRVLRWALAKRWVVVLLALAAVAGSLALVPRLGTEFIPQMDEGTISIEINLPHGSRLADTAAVVAQVEAVVRQHPEVETVFTSVGSNLGQQGAGMGLSSGDSGRLDLQLAALNQRSRTSNQVAEAIRLGVNQLPGAEFKVSAGNAMMGGGFNQAPLQVTLRGDDMQLLTDLSREIARRVAAVAGTREVETSLEESRPELEVVVDRDQAASYGLKAAQVASMVRAAVQGQVATRYRTGSDEIDVRVRLVDDQHHTLNDLTNLALTSPLGQQVPLGAVAAINVVPGLNSIERQDRVRTVNINSQLDGSRTLGAVVADIKEQMADLQLPPGYSIKYGGETQQMQEAFGDLTLAVVLAIVLVYMVLAAQFESLLHPLVIMFSLPTMVVGVILGLALTGRSFSVPAFIGIVMLAGIVVNNAIVLVDYTNTLRRRGMERMEALLVAGPHRLRPILMTSLTTVLGLLPLALGIGEGAEAEAPMATVVIGGLLTSTMLTLVLVPAVYVILEDLWAGLIRVLGFGRSRKGSGIASIEGEVKN